MDPNRPRKDPRTTKTKTKAKTTHRVEARSIFSSQPLPGANVGLSQPGFGIISNLNDTMRRHQGEASSSSSSSNATIRISGMNHILGVAQQESHANCNPTPPSSEPQTSPSLVSLNNDIIYENSPSSYQVASMSIPNPSMNPVPVAADVRNHADLSLNPYVQVGESGASETFRDYIDFGDGSGSDLTNYGISLDGQNMGLNSGMDDYSRHYVPNMNESGTEHLQPVPISSEQYDSQQENWYHPERNPASAFQMLERFANPNPPFHIRQPGESIISQGTQGQHLHPLYPPNTLAPPTATIVAPEAQEQDLILLPGIPGQAQTYEDPGASYATNDDPRQYLLLNQGGSQPQSQIQHADYLSMTNESTEQQNQHMISDEDVLNVCLGNTPAALPPIQLMSTPAALPPSQLMSGNDNTQQQYQPQPTRSVIMHTNSVQHPNHESEIPSEPGSSLSVNDDVKVSPKKKKSVPRKPRKPVEVEKQNETLAELFISVIDKATCNKNQQIENAGLELVRISNVHGVDLVEGNASVRNEGEVSDKQGSLSNDLEGLASRVSLFSELPVNPESVYQGGDLFIMKTCHEGHPLPPSSGAAIVGASSLAQISPGVSESTPLTKKPRKKTEPKPKATTPRKPRVTKAKTKETDSTDKTSQNKGQRSKKVVKKELDQVQMEEVMLSAVGTVLGKDAAKYCEDEQVKVPIKLEETVSDGASATNKLVANLPDLTVSLLTMTEAELAALTTPSKTTAPVTSIKSERSDENSDASSIAENKDNKGKRATSGKSANRNRARRRVSLDVTSESGDDEDYTPRTTRSRSAKVKSVSSSGRSATGVDSDSRSSAGHRWKDSADYGEAEVTSDLDSESGTIKVVGKHGDNSAAQDERTIKQEDEVVKSSSASHHPSKTVAAKRGRKMTAGNVRKLGRPKQFRALKKGQESKENRGVFRDDEVYPDSQVPSQDCFVDENLVMKVRRRGKNKKKVVDTPEDQDDEKQDKFFHYRRPNYTPEENKLLYGDRRFVIDVKDIDKDPSNIHIWQILEPLCCLLRYFPCKFGYQQFFISSHQRWYFFEEEFRNEEFYDRFQPIVTNVASTEIKFAAGWEMEECVVQYPYVDKSFFNRMTKSISKIHCTEFLRNDITLCIPLMLYQHLNPQSLTKLFIAANDPQSLTPDIMRNIHAWYNLGSYIDATLTNAANGKCDFNQETIYLLRTFPKMRYSNKTANKEMHCTACTPKFQRTPMVKVVFNTKQELGTPYDPVTLVEHPYPQKPRNDAEHWCRNCSLAAKKFHRLAHFRYSFSRIMRHNIAKDVQAMRERGVTVTDNSLLRISDIDVNWRYTLFLDLQLSIAEVMAEFYHDQHKP